MKALTILAAFIISIVLLSSAANVTSDVSAQGKKPPEVIVLGKEAKLGQITFNHLKHITENRSPDASQSPSASFGWKAGAMRRGTRRLLKERTSSKIQLYASRVSSVQTRSPAARSRRSLPRSPVNAPRPACRELIPRRSCGRRCPPASPAPRSGAGR